MMTNMKTAELAETGVLGILAESAVPLSLKSIQTRLQRNFDKYWEYGNGVLSPTLKRLRQDGLIQRSTTEPETKYDITTDGISRLQSLLKQPIEIDDGMTISRRHQVIIQFGFLHHLPQDEQIRLLNEVEHQLQEQLDTWERRSDNARETERDSLWRGYRGDLIDLNKRVLKEHIEWVQELKTYPPQEITEQS